MVTIGGAEPPNPPWERGHFRQEKWFRGPESLDYAQFEISNIPIVLYIFWKQRQNWTRKSGWLLLVTLCFHKIDFFLKEVALPSKLAQQLIKERNRALSQNYVAIYRSPPLFVFASQFKWLFYKSISLSVSLVALDCVQPALRKDLFTSKNASLH